MKVWRILAILAWPAGVGLALLLMDVLKPSGALAQVPWPTPPPAPMGIFPQLIPASQITPVPAPAIPGGIALQVDPIFAGPIPRNPPRPAAIVDSVEADPQDRVTLQIPAGALDRTIQLTYEPVVADQVPPAPADSKIQRAFRFRTYDHTASFINLRFRYPVRLTIRVKDEELKAGGGDPARLFLAWFDPQGNRWLPLVTTYRTTDSTLQVRILQPGLFAIITKPPPVPGLR